MEWTKRLYHHEEDPPEKLWEQLSAQLDQEPWAISNKLQTHSEQPPGLVWEKINEQLERDHSQQKAIPIHSFRPKILRVAVAAAVTGLLLWSGYYFLVQKDSSLSITDAISKSNEKKSESMVPDSGRKTVIDSGNKSAGPAPNSSDLKEVSSGEVAANEPPAPVNRYKFVRHAAMVSHEMEPIRTSQLSLVASYNLNASSGKIKYSKGEELGTYLTVMGPEGQIIKLSPKFRQALPYIKSGEQINTDFPDYFLTDEYYWQKMIADWKQKVSSSNIAPDSRNFMDILELVKLLRENN